jgi:hypothetical protein
MIKRTIIVFNWFALAIMIAVNVLATTSSLNGLSTKDVSDRYPNFFVPAGFTFSIWSVIYILLIGFVIQGTILSAKRSNSTAAKLFQEISPFFVLSCFLNAGWIFAWQYLQIELSVGIMLCFLSLLTWIYIKTQPYRQGLKISQYIWLYLPFAVYLGWISVATIANITALLVDKEWDGFGIAAVTWSYVMVLVATLLGLLFSIIKKEWAYTLVVIWALYGIYAAQKEKPETDQMIPLIALAFLFLAVLLIFFRKSRQAN